MNRQLFIFAFIVACLTTVSYADITCYVCVSTSCGDPFQYNGDTMDVFKYTYNSSFIACAKIVLNSDGSVVRGGITEYDGPTWNVPAGTVYACQNDICNGAFRTQATSTLILLFLSLLGGVFVKQQLV